MTSDLESSKRQNQHFVRDFLQIPHFQLENLRFRASFSYKDRFTWLQSWKSMTFAKLPPLFKTLTKCCACHDRRACHCDSSKSPRHMLRLPRHRERPHHKVLCLPRKNDALALTRFQSIVPVTQNAKTTSQFADLVAPKYAFRARLPPLFILWRKGLCRSACVPPNGEKLTSWRRVGDELKRRRTRREHRSNPRPQLKTGTIRYAFGKQENHIPHWEIIELLWLACFISVKTCQNIKPVS